MQAHDRTGRLRQTAHEHLLRATAAFSRRFRRFKGFIRGLLQERFVQEREMGFYARLAPAISTLVKFV